jgi:hypothetical protein
MRQDLRLPATGEEVLRCLTALEDDKLRKQAPSKSGRNGAATSSQPSSDGHVIVAENGQLKNGATSPANPPRLTSDP